MANEAIREKAKESGVRLWEVAEKIGVADSTFCRQMRRELKHELTPRRKERRIMAVWTSLVLTGTVYDLGVRR